jgi:hypothetical protein
MTTPSTTTKDMRSFLVAQMHGVANGKVQVERAKATANLAQQVVNTLNIEIKMATANKKLGTAVKPLKL